MLFARASQRFATTATGALLAIVMVTTLVTGGAAGAQKRFRVKARRTVSSTAMPPSAVVAAPVLPAAMGPGPGDPRVVDLLNRTNADRAVNGLPALRWDPRLGNLASQWSQDMAANGFRHRSLSEVGIGTGQFADLYSISENIAMGEGVNTAVLHDLLMRSPGHLVNTMDGGSGLVGIGAACDARGQMWITVNFGGDGTGVVPDAPGGQRATGASGGQGC